MILSFHNQHQLSLTLPKNQFLCAPPHAEWSIFSTLHLADDQNPAQRSLDSIRLNFNHLRVQSATHSQLVFNWKDPKISPQRVQKQQLTSTLTEDTLNIRAKEDPRVWSWFLLLSGMSYHGFSGYSRTNTWQDPLTETQTSRVFIAPCWNMCFMSQTLRIQWLRKEELNKDLKLVYWKHFWTNNEWVLS